MNRHENDDRLSRALRELEAPPASPGFTKRVLARIESGEHRQPAGLRWAVAGTAAALLAVAVALLPRLEPEPAETSARAEQLELERTQLLDELRALEQVQRPVIYLGSNSDYDLVLDLDPLLAGSERAPAVPALQDLRLQRPDVRNASRRRP